MVKKFTLSFNLYEDVTGNKYFKEIKASDIIEAKKALRKIHPRAQSIEEINRMVDGAQSKLRLK